MCVRGASRGEGFESVRREFGQGEVEALLPWLQPRGMLIEGGRHQR